MTAQPDTLRKLEGKLDDAMEAYVYDNGGNTWHQAEEYRDTGYFLAGQAFAQTEEDPQVFIEDATKSCEEGSGYLVLVAAEYRLAELQAERAKKADAFFGLACEIVASATGTVK